MNIVNKRILAGIVSAVLGLSLVWVAGFNFNERGAGAFAVAVFILWLVGLTLLFPFIEE